MLEHSTVSNTFLVRDTCPGKYIPRFLSGLLEITFLYSIPFLCESSYGMGSLDREFLLLGYELAYTLSRELGSTCSEVQVSPVWACMGRQGVRFAS